MAAAVTAEILMKCTARETLGTGVPASTSAGATITHNQYGIEQTINATSTVPATKVVSFLQALTAGTATIDLTALTGANGASVTLSGLKVQYFYMKATATNTGAITATEGASNGYELLGNGWTLAVADGMAVAVWGEDETPDVAAGAKTIDLSGTGSETVEIMIVAG